MPQKIPHSGQMPLKSEKNPPERCGPAGLDTLGNYLDGTELSRGVREVR